MGKDNSLTSDIEHLSSTLGQRGSHLVRTTLSISKKLENPIGAIWLFPHNDHCGIRQKLDGQGNSVFSASLP